MSLSQICCDGNIYAKDDVDDDQCCRNRYGEVMPFNSQTHVRVEQQPDDAHR